jgi:hypothetical protein
MISTRSDKASLTSSARLHAFCLPQFPQHVAVCRTIDFSLDRSVAFHFLTVIDFLNRALGMLKFHIVGVCTMNLVVIKQSEPTSPAFTNAILFLSSLGSLMFSDVKKPPLT